MTKIMLLLKLRILVLISTYWNVNIRENTYLMYYPFSFNLNLLECKSTPPS